MSAAEGCVRLSDIQTQKRGRNYSLALRFALSASLLILVFNNSRANAELQMRSRKNWINWPSSQAWCKSLGWCVNDSPRTPTAQRRGKTKQKESKAFYKSRSTLCVSVLQSGHNFLNKILQLHRKSLRLFASSAVLPSFSYKLEVNISRWL